jgi:hypothetical protein
VGLDKTFSRVVLDVDAKFWEAVLCLGILKPAFGDHRFAISEDSGHLWGCSFGFRSGGFSVKVKELVVVRRRSFRFAMIPGNLKIV